MNRSSFLKKEVGRSEAGQHPSTLLLFKRKTKETAGTGIQMDLQFFGGRGASSSGESRSAEEAVAALNALPNFGNKDKLTKQYTMKQNPLFDHATPNEVIKAQAIDMSITGEDRNKGVIKNVDMSKVASTQPFVSTSAIKNAIQNPSFHQYSSDLPVAVMLNGKVFLVDGNHRGVTAFLKGDRKLKVRIIG